jgi:hypothetical protein
VDGKLGYLLKAGSYAINGSNYGFILTIILGICSMVLFLGLIYQKRKENTDKKTLKRSSSGNHSKLSPQLNIIDMFDEKEFNSKPKVLFQYKITL